MEKHKISLYGKGVGVFENTGDPRNDRLIMKFNKDFSFEPGPGLGDAEGTLINKIKATIILRAITKIRNL